MRIRLPDAVTDCAFSSDSANLAVLTENRTLIFPTPLRASAEPKQLDRGGVKLSWAPNNYLAIAAKDVVYVSDGDGRMTEIRSIQKEIKTIAWSRDGRHIAVGGDDRHIAIWSRTDNASFTLRTYRELPYSIRAIVWKDDNVIVGGLGFALEEYSAQNLELVRAHQVHTWIYAIAVSLEQQRIALGMVDGSVRVGNLNSFQFTKRFKSPYREGSIHSMAFSPDGAYLLCAIGMSIRIFNVKAKMPYAAMHKFLIHTDTVRAVDWSSDKRLIASVGADNLVWSIWTSRVPLQKPLF